MSRWQTSRGLALAALLALANCAHAQHAPSTERRAVSSTERLAAAGGPSAMEAPTGALTDRTDAVAQAFRERGAHPVAERWTRFLPPEGLRTLRVHSDRDACIGFVAVGRESLTDIDLDVRNTAASRIAQDSRSNAHPYVRVCLRSGDDVYVVVRAVHGAGEVSVITMTDPPVVPPDLDPVLGVRTSGSFTPPRTPRIAIGTDPAVPDAAHALERAIQHLSPLGYRRSGLAMAGRLEMQHEESRDVRLVGGRCYAVVATGGPGVEDLDLRLLASENRPIAGDDSTDNHPTLRACPRESGTYEVQVRMFAGGGEWAFAVLEMDPAIELGADVIGIERANSLELAADGRRHGLALMMAPMRGALIAGAPLSIPVSMRRGRCYLFGAAAGQTIGGASVPGLDMALLDDRGAVVASDTASREVGRIYHCADRAMRGRVQVRAVGGRGEFNFLALEGRSSAP